MCFVVAPLAQRRFCLEVASVMILCAGLGTRLHPLTEELPKPLVPFGKQALLVHTLEKLLELGIRDIALNTHYQQSKIASKIKRLGFEVQVIYEPIIRGTAGGVAGARNYLKSNRILLINGDIVGELPIWPLLQTNEEGMVFAMTHREKGQGTLGVGAQGEVVRLRGELFGEEVSSGDYMGVAMLGPQILERLPERGCLVGDVALPWLREGGTIQTLLVPSGFWDIGTPLSYWEAHQEWLKNEGHPEQGYEGPGVSRAPGVQVRGSVLGAGAQIQGEGWIEECVIWPGARVTAPLRRAIVTTQGRIVQVDALTGGQ